MSSVSADRPGKKGYHHGALHSALIEASIALAREGGPDRVILREAARAAGVSHSAAYRHFTDREALLAEVSRHARKELAAEMRRRVNRTNDPRKHRERADDGGDEPLGWAFRNAHGEVIADFGTNSSSTRKAAPESTDSL